MKKHDFYVASPLFSDTDNAQLDIIEKFLDDNGFTYFSPRQQSKIDFKSAVTKEQKNAVAQQIFDVNVNGIEDARAVLVNTKGIFWDRAVYSDTGTMFELGFAIAKNIPVVTFNFDGFDLNIMLSQSVVAHLKVDGMVEGSNNSHLELLKLMKTDIQEGTMSPSELRSKYTTIIDSFELNGDEE